MVRKRKSKYFEPQTNSQEKKCEHPDCDKAGLYRAPKSKSLDGYYWFCLEHVRESNTSWNYYGDMSEKEIEQQLRNDTVWQRPTWKQGEQGNFHSDISGMFDAFGIFNDTAKNSESSDKKLRISAKELEAMLIMELDFPLTKEKLKEKYKKLVKIYHPDVSDEDKKSDEQFKQISIAYNLLLNSLSKNTDN